MRGRQSGHIAVFLMRFFESLLKNFHSLLYFLCGDFKTPLFKYMSKEIFSEVKLHTDKSGIIQLLNTLLNNVGDYRYLTMEDSDKVITETLEYINSRYSFNLLHFVNWAEYKGTRGFNINSMKKHSNKFAKVTRMIKVKDMYYLEFIVDYRTFGFEKVVAQYSDMTCVVDNYLYMPEFESGFNRGENFIYSQILSKINGTLSSQYLNDYGINELQSLYPIHYGHVELSMLYGDMLKIEHNLSGEIQKSTLNDILSHLKSKFNSKYQIWSEGKEKVLNENIETYESVDLFAPFYFSETENSELKIWSLNNGGEYTISDCITNKNKSISKLERKGKEVPLLPLW